MRLIRCTIDSSGDVEASKPYIGYQGEHNATRLEFILPTSLRGMNYNIEVRLPDNSEYLTPILSETNGKILYDVPVNFTAQKGNIELNLYIHNNDESFIFRTELLSLEVRDAISSSEMLIEDNPSFFEMIENQVVNSVGTVNYEFVDSIEEGEVTVGKVNNSLNFDFKIPSGEGGTGTGADGKSAYEIAVENGFVGTEQEWLLSLKGADGAKGDKGDQGERGLQGEQGLQGIQGLKGDKGDKGDTGERGLQGEQGIQGIAGQNGIDGQDGYTPIKGVDYFDGTNGTNGQDGDSAYQTWLDLGNVGTEQDFINSLKGAKGDKGDTGEQGIQGIQGIQGVAGQNGADGQDGYTVTVRQTVLTGKKDISGADFFGVPDGGGLNLLIEASESEPLILTAANGFDANGYAVDYVKVFTENQTLSDLTPNIDFPATSDGLWIYYDFDTETFGFTAIKPRYFQFLSYSPTTNGLHSFDITEMKMYEYITGTGWVERKRVFIGIVGTSSSALGVTYCLAFKGYYDSGFFSVAAATNYTIYHNIGMEIYEGIDPTFYYSIDGNLNDTTFAYTTSATQGHLNRENVQNKQSFRYFKFGFSTYTQYFKGANRTGGMYKIILKRSW